ncbi:MAG: Molybdopterin-synthase adenylyltransferase [Chloroflexi bacterium ADurb.Bin180]|nr:MAG: Molybdopterin-synthase adenylyltransferase [Chloroflexi bacterium ADurb.Bin180]
MIALAGRLRALSVPQPDGSGAELRTISLANVVALARELRLRRRQVELAALQEHILPERYLRSLGTVGWEGQIKLLSSTVGVVGVGGLGGWVIMALARMGVGRLIIIDGDVFADSNLNRQALCRESDLGRPKVDVAARWVRQVNAAVQVRKHYRLVNEEDMVALLAGSEVVVDALDSLPTRLALQRAARRLQVPLVHGAIAGYVGQVMTIWPADGGLLGLYGSGDVAEHGVEMQWGNPAATPMMTAAWQVQEVIKLLIGRGEPLRCKMLFMDAEWGQVDILQVP